MEMNYLYLKALHIIFIVTWFAGLFYIVRLFVYQVEAAEKSNEELKSQLALMARRLWLGITWPSAIITLIFGTSLIISNPAWLKLPFMHIKLGFVFFTLPISWFMPLYLSTTSAKRKLSIHRRS